MTSKERVIKSINHEEVDRVPFDFWIEKPALERLNSFLDIADLDSILDKFKVDIRHIEAHEPKEKKLGKFYQNFWGERYIYKNSKWGPTREDIPGALSEVKNNKELKDFDWPKNNDFSYAQIGQQCDKYENYAIMYGFADIWQRPCLLRGMENALMDLYINPEWVHFLGRKFTDFYIEDYKNAYKASSGRIDIFLVISDLGTQHAPLISLELFDEFIAPYLIEIVNAIHDLGAFVMYHSCGMVLPFIERLIEIGIDILDPIQPVAPEMSPRNLKDNFGDQLCFHGGIDVQKLLSQGIPEDVKKEIKYYLDTFGKEGGYICSPSHLFQPDIPPENILAFYEMTR